MGVCTSKTDGGKAAAAGKTIAKAGPSEEKLPKLMLIGAGGGGKSTIMKQLRILCGKGFDDQDRGELVPIVHYNAINSMRLLCTQSKIMKIDVVSQESRNFILNMQDHQEVMNPTMVRHLQALWRDDGIQHTYQQRHTFPLPLVAHCDYFLTNAERAADDAYLPSNEDILRCSARTTGIVEGSVAVGDSKFVVYDVGGQRAERKKWVHCLKEASCLIYVAGVSGFDEKLVEDPDDNRLSEEFKLFEGVCDMFPTKQIVLILNKTDTLREKISRAGHKGSKFSAYFPDCRDDSSYDKVLEWVKAAFLARNKYADRPVSVFNLNAIDRDQVLATFGQIKVRVPKNVGVGAPSSK